MPRCHDVCIVAAPVGSGWTCVRLSAACDGTSYRPRMGGACVACAAGVNCTADPIRALGGFVITSLHPLSVSRCAHACTPHAHKPTHAPALRRPPAFRSKVCRITFVRCSSHDWISHMCAIGNVAVRCPIAETCVGAAFGADPCASGCVRTLGLSVPLQLALPCVALGRPAVAATRFAALSVATCPVRAVLFVVRACAYAMSAVVPSLLACVASEASCATSAKWASCAWASAPRHCVPWSPSRSSFR